MYCIYSCYRFTMSSNVSYALLSHLLQSQGGIRRKKRNAPKTKPRSSRAPASRAKKSGKGLPAVLGAIAMPLLSKLASHLASKLVETPLVKRIRAKVGLGRQRKAATVKRPMGRGYVLPGGRKRVAKRAAAPRVSYRMMPGGARPKKRVSPFVDSRRKGIVPF